MKDKDRKNDSDRSRTFNIILSAVIALLLWSYVIIQVNPTKTETIANVPVNLLNIQSLTARELAIYGDGEYTVDVVVKGRRADIIKIGSDDIIAEVDLFGWSKGDNYIPVNVKVPAALEIVEVRSAKIQMTIEDLVALSKPVVVSYRGEFPVDTEEGEVDLRPAAIEVTGAKTVVESVHEIRVYVDAEDIEAAGTDVQCEAIPLNSGEIIVENVKLSSNYVNVSAKLLNLKELPLIVQTTGSPGEGYGAEINAPQTIIIKSTKQILADIESISAEAIDVSKFNGSGSVALNLLLPDGVELSKKNLKPVAAIKIEQTASKEFKFTKDDIMLEGLTQGKTVQADATEIKVTVTGRRQVVEQIEAGQLQLYIEVGELAAGSHAVPLLISSKVPLHKVIVEPSEIPITVIEQVKENLGE
ncbi:hypothetical protein MASR2M70_08290 [Bacillota bacterium]